MRIKQIKLGTGLPEHLIYTEILSRLPINSLVRFKSVCKHWNLFISSHDFMKLRLQRVLDSCTPNVLIHELSGPSKQLFSVAIQGERQYNGEKIKMSDYFRLFPTTNIKVPNVVVSRLHPSYELNCLVGTCNGLICAKLKGHKIFSIWNPALRQQRQFKGPKLNSWTSLSGFGYDSSSDDYKIVVLAGSNTSLLNAHLFTLRTKEWKILNVDWETLNLSLLSKDNLEKYGDWPLFYINGILPMATNVDEILHWPLNNNYEDKSMLAFDLANETFFTIPLPNPGLDRVSYRYFLSKVRNKLAVGLMWPSLDEGYVLQVLTMEVYKVLQSWKTFFRVTYLEKFNLNVGYPTMFEFRGNERAGVFIFNTKNNFSFLCIQQQNGDDHHVPIEVPLQLAVSRFTFFDSPITYTESLISPFLAPTTSTQIPIETSQISK